MYITRETNDACHAVAMTTVMSLVLLQLRFKFPDFNLNKDRPPQTKQGLLSHFKRLQMGIFGFSQKETEATSVAMATTLQVPFCFFCDV